MSVEAVHVTCIAVSDCAVAETFVGTLGASVSAGVVAVAGGDDWAELFSAASYADTV